MCFTINYKVKILINAIINGEMKTNNWKYKNIYINYQLDKNKIKIKEKNLKTLINRPSTNNKIVFFSQNQILTQYHTFFF